MRTLRSQPLTAWFNVKVPPMNNDCPTHATRTNQIKERNPQVTQPCLPTHRATHSAAQRSVLICLLWRTKGTSKWRRCTPTAVRRRQKRSSHRRMTFTRSRPTCEGTCPWSDTNMFPCLPIKSLERSSSGGLSAHAVVIPRSESSVACCWSFFFSSKFKLVDGMWIRRSLLHSRHPMDPQICGDERVRDSTMRAMGGGGSRGSGRRKRGGK